MTISSEITKLINNLAACYTKCTSKGATIPQDENFDNLADCINSIPTATLTSLNVAPSTTAQTLTPSSPYNGFNRVNVWAVTSSIDANITAGNIKSGVNILGVTGTYEGSGGVGITREVSNTGVYRVPATSFTFSLPSNATDVGYCALQYAFSKCNTLTSVDLSSLTTISSENAMYNAFQGCTHLTSVDLSSLTTISGKQAMASVFQGCTALTTLDLSSLTTISGESAMSNAFSRCTALTTLDLSSLTTISGLSAMYNVFQGCTALTTLDLSGLTTMSTNSAMNSAFPSCTNLTSVDLSGLTTIEGSSAMASTFKNCSSLTSVNFSNLEQIGKNANGTNNAQFSNCFTGCSALTTLNFPKLEEIYCTGGTNSVMGTFYQANGITKMYFPKLDAITYGTGASSTNQDACKNIFYGCSSLTELHFAAANQAAIEASAGYSTAWGRGAGNVTIYFDL